MMRLAFDPNTEHFILVGLGHYATGPNLGDCEKVHAALVQNACEFRPNDVLVKPWLVSRVRSWLASPPSSSEGSPKAP